MSKTAKQQLKTWFQNLKKPTQEQFWHWLDSYWHKDEKIPQSAIEDWDEFLKSLPNDGELKNYLLKDGANINAENREVLRAKLGVGDLPPNLGLVDAEEEGNVYTKAQVEALLPTKNLSNADQAIPKGENRKIKIDGSLAFQGISQMEQVQFTPTTTKAPNSLSSDGKQLTYTKENGKSYSVLTTEFTALISYLESLSDSQKEQIFEALGGIRVIKLQEEDAIPTSNKSMYLKQIP